MDAEDAVLTWLDFTYEPACGMKDCTSDGFGLVSFQDHDACDFNSEPFYVCCMRHLYGIRAGHGSCPHCKTRLKMKNCLFL